MNIYRHIKNRKLYTIERLIIDLKHLNNNEFAGIYAYPYKHSLDTIVFLSKDENKCKCFVEENFNLVSIK
jgi:hypothetical protein